MYVVDKISLKGGDLIMLKKKSDNVILTVVGVNNQENSPVLNWRAEYPEIVIDGYKYMQYSTGYHMYVIDNRIVITTDKAVSLVESEIDLFYVSKIYHDLYSEFKEDYEAKQLAFIASQVKAILIDFLDKEIYHNGYKAIRITSDIGGDYLDDIGYFSSLIAKHINLEIYDEEDIDLL